MINELSLLDELLNGTMGMYGAASSTPDVDVIENKDNYVLSMDLPGLGENDVDISIKDNVLTIKSDAKEEKKDENKAKDDNKNHTVYLLKERRRLNFARSFTLPKDADNDSITADFTNGVLDIVIGKKEAEKARKISINVA